MRAGEATADAIIPGSAGESRRGPMRPLRATWQIVASIYDRLSLNDGWAIASHIALSALLALFPFLIFLTALAAFFGTQDLTDTVVNLMFSSWPDFVAAPLALEVRAVLTRQHGELLTLGGALALWFASSGVESLRIGLNRAYGAPEGRSWIVTRLQSILFVLVGAIGLLALAFMVVLAPTVIRATAMYLPEIEQVVRRYDVTRYAATCAVLLIGLFVVHLFLPAGRRSLRCVLPGVMFTLAAWLAAGVLFGAYLTRFSTYAVTYAGFAGAMMALVFLYFLSIIFIIGGELNAAVLRRGNATVAPSLALR